MTTTSPLKRTALFEEHKKLGGRLIDFGGWELPVQYSGVIDEHVTCRTSAGLFDVSHMGEILVSGGDAERFVYHLVSNNTSLMKTGQAQYSILCYPNGNAVDDLILYRLEETRFLICVNASNTEKDFHWMKEVHELGRFACKLENVSASYSQIAIQGPKASEIIQKLTRAPVSEIKPFHFLEDWIAGVSVITARTGYTGEDGFEIYCPWTEGPKIWNALLEKGGPLGMKPCGLGARDTLRLEMKYPLYGQELSSEINPLEAGLGWAVKLDKSDFMGRDALIKIRDAGLKKKIVGLELKGSGIPRTGYKVFNPSGDREIGSITSGTQSPMSKKSIGIAYIETEFSKVGNKILVEIRGNKIPSEIVSTPFYKRPH